MINDLKSPINSAIERHEWPDVKLN